MNYFELQIGSIVRLTSEAMLKCKTKAIDNIWVIRSIGRNVELEPLYNSGNKDSVTVKLVYIEPIRITEEILELFGFRRVSQHKREYKLPYGNPCSIEFLTDSKYIYFTAGTGYPISRKICYIHQLQLLTMAITGSMLKRPD